MADIFSLPRMGGDSYHLENLVSIDYFSCDLPAKQSLGYVV